MTLGLEYQMFTSVGLVSKMTLGLSDPIFIKTQLSIKIVNWSKRPNIYNTRLRVEMRQCLKDPIFIKPRFSVKNSIGSERPNVYNPRLSVEMTLGLKDPIFIK